MAVLSNSTRAMQVLILNHEEDLFETVATYLKNSGYNVCHCRSAESAVEQFNEANGAIDLLITDVALEAGSGVEVAIQLRRSTPELKLLFMSGRPFNEWRIWDAALYCQLPSGSVRVFQKEYSALDLLIKVDELMGAPVETATTPLAVATSA